MARRLTVTVALTLLVAVAVAAGARSGGTPDQRVAAALVVKRSDVPRSWGAGAGASTGRCARRLSGVSVTGSARDSFGTPNWGAWSIAYVFKTRGQARRYHAYVARRMPGCLKRDLQSSQVAPTFFAAVRPLSLPRYGDLSAGWRLRFSYRGQGQSGVRRFRYDWAVVTSGRAVVVDIVLACCLDARWSDHGQYGGGSVRLLRGMLTNGLARASLR